MADKGAADHAFKPGPFAFGANGRVDADKAATGLDEVHKGESLCIGVEDLIVGIGEDEGVILLQVFVGKVGGRVGDIDLEAVLKGKFTDTGHGGGDVLMDVALTVLSVYEDADVFPVKARRSGRGRNDK